MQIKINFLRIICIFLFISFGAHFSFAQRSTSDELFTLAKIEGNQKGNFEKAANYCEQALKIAPLDMDIKEYLGKSYMELGQLDKARITLLDVLDKSPKRVDARHYLVNIETQTQRYSSAVCYVNELLEITPYSKTLWMKKINLYSLMDNQIEAHRATKRLYHVFPEDEEVRQMYNNILKEEAQRLSKSQDIESSIQSYETALKVVKNDPELYISLINAHIRMGNYDAAMQVADQGLYYFPNNREIFNKKIGILESQYEYQKAIDLVNARLAKGNDAYYSGLVLYLTSEAARHYRNKDPYELYGQIYEKDKSNRDAYNYLLNTALARGYFGTAQELISQGLKANPTSKEMLSKQLYLYEMQQNKEGERATVEKLYKLYPQDAEVREKYDIVSFQQAKLDYLAQDYKAAKPAFQRLTLHPELGKSARQYLFSVYMAQRNFELAGEVIDDLMLKYPDDYQLVLRKIDLLVATEDFEDAYTLAVTYRNSYPEIEEYKSVVHEVGVGYIKYLNTYDDYENVKIIADELIVSDPNNRLAYNYAIGARVSMSEYQQAIDVCDEALRVFPDAKDFKIKRAGILSESGRLDESIDAHKELMLAYPYNKLLRDAYIEELFKKGKSFDDRKMNRQAKEVYEEILRIKPSEPTAAIKLANILIDEKEFEQAMTIVDNSLALNRGNNDLIYKKGEIFDKLEEYAKAKEYIAQYIPPYYKMKEHEDYLSYLDAKMLKNQVNVSYLSVRTDSIPINTSVATFEYMRLLKRNTYVGRVNYAARATGVGIQGEFDWYHTFTNKSSFLFNAGVANQFFPKLRVGLSYFLPIKKEWQVEIGGRYMRLSDNTNFFTAIGGIEKTFDRLWLNARVFVMSDSNRLYNNILLQSRFFMNNERDYLVAMASAGNAPEDTRLDFQIDTFLSYVNTMVGAGYFHFFTHRTSMGVMGNWFNYQLGNDFYLNQYNLFIIVRTKF